MAATGFNTDRGFVSQGDPNTLFKGYQNGDFDFSGTIDSDDFALIDSAFGKATTPFAAPAAAAAAPVKRTRGKHHRHNS